MVEDGKLVGDHLDQQAVVEPAPQNLRDGAALGAPVRVGMRSYVPRSRITLLEQGTHLGLGSCAPLLLRCSRNGHGRLTTIDVDAEAGYLIGEPWASVIDRRTGSSIDVLAGLSNVDMFLHDSLHTYDYETKKKRTTLRSSRTWTPKQ